MAIVLGAGFQRLILAERPASFSEADRGERDRKTALPHARLHATTAATMTVLLRFMGPNPSLMRAPFRRSSSFP